MGTTPQFIIGIDPSLRRTGIAVLNSSGEIQDMMELRPPHESVLDAAAWTMKASRQIFTKYHDSVYCMERMITARSGNLLFYVHMRIAEAMDEVNLREGGPWLMNPLPIQLKSYLRKYGVTDISKKTPIVAAVKRELNGVIDPQKVTSNTADAYFLARLALDCIKGDWGYNLPKKEIKLVSWRNYNCQKL